MEFSRHIYLTGYRGTGKTSVGVLLAKTLGRPIIDSDQVVEANAGKSIREIFDEGGETLFRDLESEALTNCSEAPPSVISLGGGAILREESRQLIHSTGVCFWLDADAETIAGRIENDASTTERRPPLTELKGLEEIRQLLGQRRGLYEAAADCQIDTSGKDVDQVAREILEQLRQIGVD